LVWFFSDQQLVVARIGHAFILAIPAFARFFFGTYYEFVVMDFQFDTILDPALLKYGLGNTDAPGVSDLDYLGSHNYNVSTFGWWYKQLFKKTG